MRPRVELVTTTSFTATYRSPSSASSGVGSSDTTYSPPKTRVSAPSMPEGSIEARKPTRPKLTPITGTPLPSRCASVRRIVPSPPSATVRSDSRGSSTIRMPSRSASARTRSSASRTSTRPCVTIAAALIRCDCCGDPLVEVIRKGGVVGLHEVEEELPVALRPRQPGVYDADDARPPRDRGLGDLAKHARSHGRVTNDALRDVRAAGLELRLHEDHGHPAASGEAQRRGQRDPHGDEGDVADDQLRRERQLRELACIRLLHDGHALVAAELLVQLMGADVDRDHACGA